MEAVKSVRDQYSAKRTSAAQAVQCVRSGDWIDFGWMLCLPPTLDHALAARYEELEDVKIRCGIIAQKPAVMQVPDVAQHFVWHSWHAGSVDRKMIDAGIAWHCPLRYSELPRYYREEISDLRAVMIQTAPMDEEGYFCFGLNASHLKAVIDRAQYVIIEENENFPRVCGGEETHVHISQVDMVVRGDNPPIGQSIPARPTSTDITIAKQVIPLIPDGACLQLGIGGMPSAVGELIAQSDLKDLGVHTEMYVDAFVSMAEAGKLSGARKGIDRGLQVYTFAAGTPRLYEYLKENPACRAYPVDYTNDVRVIAQLDNFISINSAVDIDLFGQIASETAGLRHISGAGGQQDFMMGAYLSRGGKSFICFTSTVTDKQGNVSSRIRPTLREGTVVTSTRSNAHYLLSEYGCVNLKGASTWERAERIISIAHPDFRDELIEAAQRMKIWRRTNKLA